MQAGRLNQVAARAFVGALCALILWLVTGSAEAAPPGGAALPITVVAVNSEAFEQADALTQALRKVVRDSAGYSLEENNHALEFLQQQLACAEVDAACEERIADAIKTDRFVWAVIEFTEDEQSVEGSPEARRREVRIGGRRSAGGHAAHHGRRRRGRGLHRR
jgi:hypothetical protein